MEILTIPEAADWLKVTPKTIRNMIKRKQIVGVLKQHRLVRIPVSSMEALFN